MQTSTLERPTDEEKLALGISAILRALDDVRNGTLVCNCTDPECITRRNK